jgi:hypothetical protein
MKLINTNKLTKEQCAEIIEKSDFVSKDELTKIINNIYSRPSQYVHSISIDKLNCVLKWAFGSSVVTSRCFFENDILWSPIKWLS